MVPGLHCCFLFLFFFFFFFFFFFGKQDNARLLEL